MNSYSMFPVLENIYVEIGKCFYKQITLPLLYWYAKLSNSVVLQKLSEYFSIRDTGRFERTERTIPLKLIIPLFIKKFESIKN